MLTWSPRALGSERADPFSLRLRHAASNIEIELKPVDLTRVNEVKEKIKPFRSSDAWLRELYVKLDDYAELVQIYNENFKLCQEQMASRDREMNGFASSASNNFEMAFKDSLVQGCLHISETTMSVIEEHAEFIIASKLLNPRWHLDHFGAVMGVATFFKGVLQRRYRSSILGLASGGLLLPLSAGYSGLALSSSSSGSSSSSWGQSISRVLLTGGLGSLGGFLAMTVYQCCSSMFLSRKESELQLSLWVEQIQTRNNSLHSRFRDCHVDNRFDKMDHCIFVVDEKSSYRDQETQQIINHGNSVLNNKIDENTATIRNMFDGFGELQSAIEAKVMDLQSELGAITQSQKELHSRFFSFQSFGRSNFASMQNKQRVIARSLRLLDSKNGNFQNSIRQSIAEGVAAIAKLEEGQSKIRITIEDTNTKLTYMTTLVQESVHGSSQSMLGGHSPGGFPRIQSSMSSPGLLTTRHSPRVVAMRRANSPLEEIE